MPESLSVAGFGGCFKAPVTGRQGKTVPRTGGERTERIAGWI